jgi:hypothetical protein
MVKQEQSPELPVDPLAASSAMAAAAAMATSPLMGLSPLSRLPIPHQVSVGLWAGAEGVRMAGGAVGSHAQSPVPAQGSETRSNATLGAEGWKCQTRPLPPQLATLSPSYNRHHRALRVLLRGPSCVQRKLGEAPGRVGHWRPSLGSQR